MEDDSKINIYVNSKNRKSDETASNFNVMIPDGLLKIKNNQSFESNVILLMASIASIIVMINLIGSK